MSIMKRLNAKYGSHGKPTGDDKIVADLLGSWADDYVPPEPVVKKPRKPRKPKEEITPE